MDYWHKDWKCPFYKYNEQRKVCCEGGCRVQFMDKSSAGRYMSRYCASFRYADCTIAQSRIEIYEGVNRP